MSGLVGIWSLDGSPVDQRLLGRLSAAIRHRGRDGEGIWIERDAGFACRRAFVAPEDRDGLQPYVHPATGSCVAFDGRLDNRAELARALGLEGTAAAGGSDAALVAEAYAAWGETLPQRLDGDFVLAIFDRRRQRLLLARDALGVRPLYVYRSPRLVLFASEIKAILAHPSVEPRVDDRGLADSLLLTPAPFEDLDVTCFAGIRSLPASHALAITREEERQWRYWDFDPARRLRFRDFREHCAAFGELFAQAVRRRTRGSPPVAVSVSGGLDSSSILCQAISSGSEAIGISYTAADGSMSDERIYLAEIERKYGIAIARIPIEPLLGFRNGVEEQIRCVEAPFLDYMWGVTRAVHREAGRSGARVLLSGHWGDQMLFSTAYLIDLFNAFRWSEVQRHLGEYANWFQGECVDIYRKRFWASLVRHHVPSRLVPPLKWLRQRLASSRCSEELYRTGFAAKGVRISCRRPSLPEGFHSAQARALYIEARSKYHVRCMEWQNKNAALHGLDAAFPFLDRDLISFLMATPGEIHNHGGVPRALLRESMRGILPDALALRDWKADFSEPVNAGMAKDLGTIRDALRARSLVVERGYLDGATLQGELARAPEGLTEANCLQAWRIADLFGLEVWLRTFQAEKGENAHEEERDETKEEESLPQAAAHGAR